MEDLFTFAKKGDTANLERLFAVNRDIDVNMKNEDGETALMLSSQYSNKYSSLETVKLLIEKGADVNMKNKYGETALMLSSLHSNKTSNLETVKLLLDNGADVNMKNKYGETALILSSQYSNTDSSLATVQLLIEKGADVNIQDYEERTALMYSSQYSNTTSNLETVQLLIEKGADVNIQDEDGNTALMLSSQHSNTDSSLATIKLLIEKGADVNMKNQEGDTALILSSRYSNTDSNLEAVKLLIDNGARVNMKNEHGYTALMYSSQYSNKISSLATVQLLIENGARVNMRNKDRETALMLSCRYKTSNLETVKLLIENGADVNMKNKDMNTPLILSIWYSIANSTSNLETVKLLIENGADVNMKNKDGTTALILSSKYSKETFDLETVELLIQKGADVNMKNNDGDTALILSSKYSKTTSSLETVKLLIENGADVNMTNKDGYTAIDYLKRDYNKDVISRLIDLSTGKNFFDIYIETEQNKKTLKNLTVYNSVKLNSFHIPEIEVGIKTTNIAEQEDNMLFNDVDFENCDISNNKAKYKLSLGIAKQTYDQFRERGSDIELPFGYFENFSVNFDNYGTEFGFDTGPTKQIMSAYNDVTKYIIQWNDEDNMLSFNTPKWVEEEHVDNFYSFLTHVIIQDINHKSTKMQAHFPFMILLPCLLKLLKEKDVKVLKLINDFKTFIKFDINNFIEGEVGAGGGGEIKYVIENDDGTEKPAFETVEAFESYVNELCLFLINDMFEQGKMYSYAMNPDSADFVFDPEAGFIDTQKEKLKTIPKAFFGFDTMAYLTTVDRIYDNLMYVYGYIQNQYKITSELFLSKIKFESEVDERYNNIFEHMRQFITNYEEGLDEETKNNIVEKFISQEILNEALLKTWTASNIITDKTVLTFRNVPQPTIQIATCFNFFGYPVPRGEYNEVTYAVFVNTIMGLLASSKGTGAFFGRGIKKFNKNKKHTKKGKKVNKNKKHTKKGKKVYKNKKHTKKGKKVYKNKKHTKKGKKVNKNKKYTKKGKKVNKNKKYTKKGKKVNKNKKYTKKRK